MSMILIIMSGIDASMSMMLINMSGIDGKQCHIVNANKRSNDQSTKIVEKIND